MLHSSASCIKEAQVNLTLLQQMRLTPCLAAALACQRNCYGKKQVLGDDLESGATWQRCTCHVWLARTISSVTACKPECAEVVCAFLSPRFKVRQASLQMVANICKDGMLFCIWHSSITHLQHHRLSDSSLQMKRSVKQLHCSALTLMRWGRLCMTAASCISLPGRLG